MIKVEQIETTTNVEVIKDQIRLIKGARNALGYAFIWEETEQGHDFWGRVVGDLYTIEVQLKARLDGPEVS